MNIACYTIVEEKGVDVHHELTNSERKNMIRFLESFFGKVPISYKHVNGNTVFNVKVTHVIPVREFHDAFQNALCKAKVSKHYVEALFVSKRS